MLAGFEGSHRVGKGRLHAAHDLRHSADAGIAGDRRHIRDLEGLVILARAHQNRTGLQAFCLTQHLVTTDAARTITHNRNFHKNHPPDLILFVI